MKASFVFIILVQVSKFGLSVDVLQKGRYTKMIWNNIKTLEIFKSAFDALKFNHDFNYILNDNGKTIWAGNT